MVCRLYSPAGITQESPAHIKIIEKIMVYVCGIFLNILILFIPYRRLSAKVEINLKLYNNSLICFKTYRFKLKFCNPMSYHIAQSKTFQLPTSFSFLKISIIQLPTFIYTKQTTKTKKIYFCKKMKFNDTRSCCTTYFYS